MRFFAIALFTIPALIACGKANSPADSIALGHARSCNDADAGVWDGLECATPHVQEVEEVPTVVHPKTSPGHRKAVPPPNPCACDPNDPLCECE